MIWCCLSILFSFYSIVYAQTVVNLQDGKFTKKYKLSPAGDGEREFRQYRIIGQERYASKFCVLTRRGVAFIENVWSYAFSARVMRLGVQTVLCSGVRS